MDKIVKYNTQVESIDNIVLHIPIILLFRMHHFRIFYENIFYIPNNKMIQIILSRMHRFRIFYYKIKKIFSSCFSLKLIQIVHGIEISIGRCWLWRKQTPHKLFSYNFIQLLLIEKTFW